MSTTTRCVLGPADHGRRMTHDEFIDAEWQEGWLYELARGVVDVTEVPGLTRGGTVLRLARMFILYADAHPGVINDQAGGGACRLRLPGMQSDRHSEQAVYLSPEPRGPRVCTRCVPTIVGAVVAPGAVHATHLLPGLEVRPEDRLGPAD